MKLHAEILPNDRKYYGTRILVANEIGSAEFVVWINNLDKVGKPSEREIDFIGTDGRYYYRDEYGDVVEYEICDDHYETEVAYKICQKIVDALAGSELA